MASISRVRATWEGFIGAPGVTTMYCLSPDSFITGMRAYLQNYASLLPDGLTIQVEHDGDVIDDVNGTLQSSWSGTAVDVVTGAGGGVYAAPVGMVINWLTGFVFEGHRVRGKTFMVPLIASCYQSDGSIDNTILASIRTASTEFVAGVAGNFVIWERPRLARAATATLPAQAAHDGGHAIVSSAQVPDKVAVLRSRRD